MWYAIMAEDTPNSLEKRLIARPEHLSVYTPSKKQADCCLQVHFRPLIAQTQGQQALPVA